MYSVCVILSFCSFFLGGSTSCCPSVVGLKLVLCIMYDHMGVLNSETNVTTIKLNISQCIDSFNWQASSFKIKHIDVKNSAQINETCCCFFKFWENPKQEMFMFSFEKCYNHCSVATAPCTYFLLHVKCYSN